MGTIIEIAFASSCCGVITRFFKKAYYYAQDNPLIVAGSLFLGILPIILFCCMGGSKASEEEDEEEEEEPVPAPIAKGKGKAKAPPTPAADNDEDDNSDDSDVPVLDVTEEKAESSKAAKGGAKKRTPKAS